jgi:UDP-N-acetylglucosamine transferase subunit ALG13
MTVKPSPAEQTAGRRIVVTVGTDHHPFERMITWTNRWLSDRLGINAACFVQWGSAATRPACAGSDFLDIVQLAELLDAADVIVCHGGPATIAEAWARSRKPIVVPRLARLGEHVDNHQAEFCEKAAELGRIALARTLADFTRLLDDAVTDPSRYRAISSSSDADLAVVRLGGLVEGLVSRRRRHLLFGRGRRLRRGHDAGTSTSAGNGYPSPEVGPAFSTDWQADRMSVRTGLAALVNEEQE